MFPTHEQTGCPISILPRVSQKEKSKAIKKESGANQNSKIEAIKKYALNFLGHGYSRLEENNEKRMLERVLENSSTDLVDLLEARTFDWCVTGTSTEEVSKEIQKKYEGEFKLAFSGVAIAPTINYGKTSKSGESTNTIVFAVCHIDYHRCTFNKIPPLRADLLITGSNRKGDSFVNSVWTYTGFKIFFEISTQLLRDKSQQNLPVRANIGFGSFGIGASVKSLNQKLENREITDIKMQGEGFGDYSVPTEEFTPQNLEDIHGIVRAIKKNYFQRVPYLQTRAFCVNDECLANYTMVPTPETPTIDFTPIFVTKAVPKAKIEPDFNALKDQIHAYNGNKLKGEINKEIYELLPCLFKSLETSFSGIFATGLRKLSCSEGSTIVIGNTGSGKSTLIGYMQDAEFVNEKIVVDPRRGTTKYAAVCTSKDADIYPEVGHLNSKTKGATVYGNYIDTAGIGDTAGLVDELCNAEAIHMMVKSYSPKRLIVVISSNIFDNRATAFFEKVDLLRRILRNPTKKNVLSSILFLVNDQIKPHKKRKGEKSIINKINLAICSLEEEKKALLPPQLGWWDWLLGQSPEVQEKELTKINDHRLPEIEEKIELLEKVVDLKNIIIADVFNKGTRKEVKKWEKKHTSNSLSFNMENFVVGGHQQFTTILREFTGYFNSLFLEKTQLSNSCYAARTDSRNLRSSK